MITTCQKCGYNYDAPTMTTIPANCPACFPSKVTLTTSLGTSPTPSPQQPSTVEEILGQLAGAASVCWQPKPTGVFDSEQASKFVDDAVAAINELRRQDMEYVIGKKFDVNQYLVKYGDGEIAYHLGEASVSVTDILKLRADQHKRLEERLNEPE